MPTDDPFPIRVYLRNEHEREFAEKVLREVRGDEAKFYVGSAEGWVNPSGLERLMTARIIVDSLAPARAAIDPAAGWIAASPTAAEGGASLVNAMEDSLRDLALEARATMKSVVKDAKGDIKLQLDRLPDVLRQKRRDYTRHFRQVGERLESQAKDYLASRDTGGPSLLGAEGDSLTAPTEELYEIVVRLPMQVDWPNQLRDIGGEITSFQAPNVFRMFLSPEQLEEIRGLDFCVEAKRYSIEETVTGALLKVLGLDRPAGAAGEAALDVDRPTGNKLQEFDVILHRAADSDRVAQIVVKLGAKVIARSPTVLRIEAPPDPGLLAALASQSEVCCLTPYVPPTLSSDRARILAGVERINASAGGANGRWNGDGELVAVFDSGVDRDHPDLKSQVQDAIAYSLGAKSGTADDLVGHGTHVCGIIAGTGAASGGTIRGMAPGAKLLSIGMVVLVGNSGNELLTPPDLEQLLSEATKRGAKIINLSWGTPLGGSYDQGARQLDKFLYEHPDVLVVVAAGNEGRAPNGVHLFNTIGTPASAKNALTVGAFGSGHDVDRTYSRFSSAKFGAPVGALLMRDSDVPAALGSRGPTDYDSVKPDVSACGVYVLAPKAGRGTMGWQPAFTQHNGSYVYLGGTSMAAPVVSGLAAILRQYLRVERQIDKPSAALLKAILIASAERPRPLSVAEGGPFENRVGYPDFHQGFGRVDLSRVLPHQQAPANRKLLFDDVANESDRALTSHALQGNSEQDSREYRITVLDGTTEPLRIALTWTDFAGNSVQNNINVFVDGPNDLLRMGNEDLAFLRDPIFDNINKKGVPFDKRNNVEQIKIDNPPSGKYVIRVVAQNTPIARQGYALCVVGCVSEEAL